MFPLGIKSTLARIISRPLTIRGDSLQVLDAYNVTLDHDWSNTSATPSRPAGTPAPRIPESSPTYELYASGQAIVNPPTANSTATEYNGDLLNDPLRELIQVPPSQTYDSIYGKQLPISIYDYKLNPNPVTPSVSVQSARIPALIRSPTPSTKTRPLFLPTRPSTPAQVVNVLPEKRKRGTEPLDLRSKEPIQLEKLKRRRIESEEPRELDIVEVSDDEPDSYGMKLTDTGYQSPALDDTLNELTSAYEDVRSRLSGARSLTGPAQPLSIRPRPPPTRFLSEWTGPKGGPIRFYTRPENWKEEDALRMRWSYADNGPDHEEVDQQIEGDIHFCPSRGRGTNEPFKYWVCIQTKRGLRWASYSVGQQHPTYRGFVMKAAAPKTKNPPRWIKEASFKSARN